VLATVLLAALAAAPADPLVSLDLREGSAATLLPALAEAGGAQAVLDPEVACRVTLKLHAVSVSRAFASVLGACGLGQEGQGAVVRIAPLAKLAREAAEARRWADARRAAVAEPGEVRLRLSHARAAQVASVLNAILAPRGRASYDERTNTLILLVGQP
jgi:type IV pilus assembly protein PilQ